MFIKVPPTSTFNLHKKDEIESAETCVHSFAGPCFCVSDVTMEKVVYRIVIRSIFLKTQHHKYFSERCLQHMDQMSHSVML